MAPFIRYKSAAAIRNYMNIPGASNVNILKTKNIELNN